MNIFRLGNRSMLLLLEQSTFVSMFQQEQKEQKKPERAMRDVGGYSQVFYYGYHRYISGRCNIWHLEVTDNLNCP